MEGTARSQEEIAMLSRVRARAEFQDLLKKIESEFPLDQNKDSNSSTTSWWWWFFKALKNKQTASMESKNSSQQATTRIYYTAKHKRY